MNIADSVQETTAGTSTATVVVSGATAGNRTFAAAVAAGAFAVGATNIPLRVEDDAGNWLTGAFTLTNATTLTRTAIGASSAAGADVTLAGTVRRVSIVPTSLLVRQFQTVADGIDAASLPAANALGGSDIVVVTQGGVDGKTTLSALAAYVASTLNTPATAITMTGPASGAVGAASSNFTVGANGTITGTIVVTPSDGGAGGTFTPTSKSISSGTPTGTFTYTPASSGAKTISVTNNGSLTNPANITYTASAAAATAITMSGPSGGVVSVASTNFTIAANGAITGTVVVTPSDAGGGGTFTPTTVSISSGTPTATFTYTPNATPAARTISATNNGSLSNPGNITYTSTAAGDTTAPTFVSAQVANATPTVIAVTMSETLANIVPVAGSFTVSGGKTVSSVSISGAVVSLTCSAAYANGDTITVQYTKPGSGNMLQDAAANLTASFGPSSVANNVAPAAPAYLFSPTPFTAPAGGNITTAGNCSTNFAIYIKTAGGVTPADVNFMWSQSSTVAPSPYKGVNPTQVAHPNDIKGCNRTGGWTQGGGTGQSYYGLYSNAAALYAWGPSGAGSGAGTWYLWVMTDDGFSKPFDNNTGTPVGYTFT